MVFLSQIVLLELEKEKHKTATDMTLKDSLSIKVAYFPFFWNDLDTLLVATKPAQALQVPFTVWL